jgi:hypothetical protein
MQASRKALLLGFMMVVGTVAVPTLASAGIDIDIDVAPPPVRVETVPPPRGGFVWAPGFWEWRGHEHVWVPGHFVHERRGSGFPIIGYRWARIGITSEVIGSAERISRVDRDVDPPEFRIVQRATLFRGMAGTRDPEIGSLVQWRTEHPRSIHHNMCNGHIPRQ